MNNFLARVDSLTRKAKEFSQEKKQEILKSFKGYQSPNSLKKGVFGLELKDALRMSETRGLPTIAARCLDFLANHTLEVGLYRVSASVKEINALAKEFQDGQDFEIAHDADVHVVAAVLKMYLRELPECLITDHVKTIFFELQNSKDSSDVTPKSENDSISSLTRACQFLPAENRSLAHQLFSHLHKVMNDSEVNKMGVLNLQLIFSPCLNIEPGIVQDLIKYPDILRIQNPSQSSSYKVVQSTEDVTHKSAKRAPDTAAPPPKPVRNITRINDE